VPQKLAPGTISAEQELHTGAASAAPQEKQKRAVAGWPAAPHAVHVSIGLLGQRQLTRVDRPVRSALVKSRGNDRLWAGFQV
jgi:hypothetical protein